MKRFYTILFTLVIPIAPLLGQNMNLTQCIHYALEHNLSYTNDEIKASITQEQYRQSQRNFLPHVGAGSSANKQYGYSIDPTTNTFVNVDFFATNFYIESQVDLFRGFARINTMRFQRMQHQISLEQLKQREIEIAFGVMNHYYDVLYFTGLQAIIQEQVELSSLNVSKTQRLIELGLKAESDLQEMKAQEATERHQLVKAQNQHQQAMLRLKNMLNYPAHEELNIETTALDSMWVVSLSPEEAYSMAMKHMPGVQIAGMEVKSAQQNLAITRANLLPRLWMGAGINTNYADAKMERVDPNDPNNLTMRTIPFADQWRQNMSQWLAIGLQVPIFNQWNGMSNVKRAKLEQRMATNRHLEAQQQLFQQVNEDLQELQALGTEQEVLKAKRDALHGAYLVAEKKLEKGLISTIEFYTAKNQLAQAEADWVRIQMQRQVKEYTIRFYLGEKIY